VLSASSAPVSITSYDYDSSNNRLHKTVGGGVTTYTYNRLNRLTGCSDTAGNSAGYTYAFNGNRATHTVSGVTDVYGYDVENRLVSLNKNIGSSAGNYSYVYDYRTRRIGRNEPAGATNLVFSGGTSVQEYSGGGSLTVDYVRGSDWGGGVGGILYSMRSGVPSFAHYNRRGDVTARTSAAGGVTWQASYKAGGTRTAEFGTTPLDRQRGNTKEDPTGLLNEGMRYRDLETDTFITRDPAGFVDGPNLCAYVRQNPWSSFDPEGLFWKEVGSWIGENVFNFDTIHEGWDLTKNADYGTWRGWGEGAIGVVGMAAGSIDGITNVATLGGKGAIEAPLKGGAKTLGKDLVKSELKFFEKKAGETAAKKLENKTAKSARDIVQEAADEAKKAVGEGKGGPHGTKVHSELEKNLKNIDSEIVHPEVSYKDGDVVSRGTEGSVRLDAVEGPKNAPINAYNLKTGGAKLTEKRVQQIRDHAPKTLQKVEEIR